MKRFIPNFSEISGTSERDLQFKKFVIGPYFSLITAHKRGKHLICKRVSNNIDELFISEKEIWNLWELLPIFVNPFRRFRESLRCFNIRRLKSFANRAPQNKKGEVFFYASVSFNVNEKFLFIYKFVYKNCNKKIS